MYRISVLISGSGSTLDNLAFHCYNEDEGMIRGFVTIDEVIADRPCAGVDIAQHWDLPVRVVERTNYASDEEWSDAIFQGEPHLFVMAGFLSKVVVPEWLTNRVVNIHPSLLPAYGGKGMYGSKVHEAVINNKEQYSGCTVHVVDNELDHGPIIGQMKVGVLPWDDAKSLEQAVRNMEKKLYPRTILNYLRSAK